MPRGFALVELLAVCLVVMVVCLLAWTGGNHARTQAGLAGSMSNLRHIGELTGAYAADFEGQLWSFSWTVGNSPSQYADLQNPSSNTNALGYQATDIARRHFDESIPRLTNRFAAYWLSTLVLVDHFQEDLPAEWVVSPGDEVRLAWQADPGNPPQLNEQGGEAWDQLFGVFGSSYSLMPAFFAPDEASNSGDTIDQYLFYHDLTSIPSNVVFGTRRVEEVSHPGSKVHLAERASFFFGPRPVYYLHQEARVPVLMADGSVSPRTSAEANPSFAPNTPDREERHSWTNYVPNPLYEPLTLSGGPEDLGLETHYKWTRRGLRGVDFSGEWAD